MSNPDVIINILLKSLSSTVHGPDFNLCLSLLREPSVSLRFGAMAGDISRSSRRYAAMLILSGNLARH
jgi:hypothetical protein